MKKILVPVDNSVVAENAADFAFHVAEAANKEIVIFHVGETRTNFELQPVLVKQQHSDVMVKTSNIVTKEYPNDKELNDLINKQHIRLVILGSVGEGSPHNKKMFGSFAQKMVASAACPVMTVPPGHTFRWISRIGYASDLLSMDEEIGKVISFARIFNSEIEIFHLSSVTPDPGATEKIDIRDKVELYKRMHQYANISYTVDEMPVDNEINEGINRFLAQKKIDLLMIFHNNKQPLEALFSSGHTNKAPKHLGVPLLIHKKN